MSENKKYDLEDRTFVFAQDVRFLVAKAPRSIANIEDLKQLVRSSGSVASNYIEANESLSKKDFVMRVKICRKEAKESRLWLRLISLDGVQDLHAVRDRLIQEALELTRIFGSIVTKNE
jgi:four helix bundle protein